MSSIASNLARVHERIAAAARRAGRSPDEISLMAVTKAFPPEIIREAYDAGQRLFGENRVQEFMSKSGAVAALERAEFHLIGHLQLNKAARAAQSFDAIDSVDSLRLAEKLDAVAAEKGKCLPVLIEINIGGEAAKSGVLRGSAELEELLAAASNLPHLEFRGLMSIPPFTEDPEGARPYFQQMRQLRDSLAARHLPRVGLDVLSIGMSHDFEIAVEEGSTCVRIGTAIFGERSPR